MDYLYLKIPVPPVHAFDEPPEEAIPAENEGDYETSCIVTIDMC